LQGQGFDAALVNIVTLKVKDFQHLRATFFVAVLLFTLQQREPISALEWASVGFEIVDSVRAFFQKRQR
jgi:hypothetical protein